MGCSLALYLSRVVPLERVTSTTRGSLFRKRRLGRRRDLLQHDVVLVLVDTELDDRVPVFAGDVVLVHALDDVIDGRLRWSLINDTRQSQPNETYRSIVYERFHNMRKQRWNIRLSYLCLVTRYLETHVDLDFAKLTIQFPLFRILTEPSWDRSA